MPWVWLVFMVVMAIVAIVTTPSVKSNSKPAGLNEFDIPTADVGREIPVLFGTRDITGANVVWYGDLSVEAIEKEGGKK